MKSPLLHRFVAAFAVACLACLTPAAPAQVPNLVQQAGTVSVDGAPFTGTGQFKFAIIDRAGSTSYWSNDGTSRSGSEPARGREVPVEGGAYSVALGDPTVRGEPPIPEDLFLRTDLHLRVWFSDGAHPFQHLAPDELFVPVGYAHLAARVAGGAVTTEALADGSVTGSKLAAGAALANLVASPGSVVLSLSPSNAALTGAGLSRLGSMPVAGEAWSRTTFVTPPARAKPVAVWTGTEAIFLGGTGSDGSNTQPPVGFRYTPGTGAFAALPVTNAPPFPGAGGIATPGDWQVAWTGRELLVWNTKSPSWSRRWDPRTNEWSRFPSLGSAGRTGASSVWTGSEWILWGGLLGANALNTGSRFDPTTDTWRPTGTNNAPTSRFDHQAIWTGSRMLVIGGTTASANSSRSLNDVWSYDPATDTWELVSGGGIVFWSPANAGKAVWTGSRLVAFGVSSPNTVTSFASGAELDPATGRWSPLPPFTPASGLLYASAVWTGQEIVLWGGRRAAVGETGVPSQNRGFAYDPANRSWREISDADAPEGRLSHAALWTGSEMLIWGGTTSLSATELADGARYRPAQDRWLPLVRPVLARQDPTVVWTGTELLVWGGTQGTVSRYAQASGARFDPATGRWRPMAIRNGPGSRTGHTAVWTGTELVIWGGFSSDLDNPLTRSGTGLNTGARYDPVRDRWTSVSLDDAPTGRGNHAAVWTGRELIIWGGNPTTSSTLALNSGARWEPRENHWTPVSTRLRGGELDARAQATALWTGREMLVWGGAKGNRGLRYEPESDTWSQLSTNGLNAIVGTSGAAPAAFWTDSGMLAWNGRWGLYDPVEDLWKPVSTRLSPGWGTDAQAVSIGSSVLFWGLDPTSSHRYDPVTDTWTRLTSVDAPPPRLGHALAWTGDTLYIVGGREANSNPAASITRTLPAYSVTRPAYLYGRP